MKTICQSEFFNLPEVKAQQEIQKRNPYGSKEHKDAYLELCRIAAEYSVTAQFGKPEDY